jgi:hypothetical protein
MLHWSATLTSNNSDINIYLQYSSAGTNRKKGNSASCGPIAQF